MPSPFPGMNPYLEQEDAWHDFHESFSPYARERLAPQLGPDYFIKIDEHVCIHEMPEEPRRLVGRSDLAITPAPAGTAPTPTTAAIQAPADVVLPAVDFEGQPFLEIRDRRNLVEIDLLRGGPRMPLENMPECDYGVLVSRVEQRRRAKFWPIRLRERLPVIPIPLREPDADVLLDLQEVLHRVYDVARYERYVYTSEPNPPLSPEDAAWACGFIPR